MLMETKRKTRKMFLHLYLLPKNAVKEFDLDKDGLKKIRQDFARNSIFIESMVSLIVSGVIIFYLIQAAFEGPASTYIERFFSAPQAAASQLIFLFSSLGLQIYFSFSVFSKKARPVADRIIEDLYVLALTLGMIFFFANDAATAQLSKSRTISPSILWTAVIAVCPIAYYTDQIIVSLIIGTEIITSALWLNQLYTVNEIHQYILVGVIYLFASYMIHAIFFYVRCQQHFIENKNEKLMLSSNYDPLTNCWNRNGLHAFISKYEGRNADAPRALLMFDIDHFKLFNDTYSHLEGDKVLRGVVQAIREAFKDQDLKLTRWGGDEFVLLMDVSGENDAVNKMEKVRKAVFDLKVSGLDDKIRVSISLGVCLTPTGMKFSFDQALNEADRCLYIAKNSGRNRSCIRGLLIRP